MKKTFILLCIVIAGLVIYRIYIEKNISSNDTVDNTSPVVLLVDIGEKPATTDAQLLRKIDQLFIIGFRGYTYNSSPVLKKAIETTNVGGVILFDYDQATKKYARNIETSPQLTSLISDIKKNASAHNLAPLFISVDEEGGKVSRLKTLSDYTKTPSAATLGVRSDAEVISIAATLGEKLKKYGFNVDFAPDMDVNVNPANPVIGVVERSFSKDPAIVSEKGIAFFRGLEGAGIISSAKHFPGHGSSVADSHLGFVDITKTHKAYELEPFKVACAAGIPMVMVGHLFDANIDPNYPATLSKIQIDILKKDIGCDTQLIVSDDIDMGAIIKQYGRTEALTRALNAGIDVLILSNNIVTYDPDEFFTARQIILDQVRAGVISEERINNAYKKVKSTKAKYFK